MKPQALHECDGTHNNDTEIGYRAYISGPDDDSGHMIAIHHREWWLTTLRSGRNTIAHLTIKFCPFCGAALPTVPS